MSKRSRTGCLTCRQRKLKCSEERPICAQCVKANRECIPSSGITFRHQQNPSLNAAQSGGNNLKSFYGYKETFAKGTHWVDVPRELTFVHTHNPFDNPIDGLVQEDTEIGPPQGYGGHHNDAGPASGAYEDPIDANLASGLAALAENASRYEENRRSHDFDMVQGQPAKNDAYATHGLEALSAVASQDQYTQAPPPASMGQSSTDLISTASPHENAASSENKDIFGFSHIDPRLSDTVTHTGQDEGADGGSVT